MHSFWRQSFGRGSVEYEQATPHRAFLVVRGCGKVVREMISAPPGSRRFHPADAVFGAFLVAYVAASVSLIPYDFTDLCYLFSLERGTWATQEWVHPIYVPTLRVLTAVVGAFGYHGHMLVPVELMNVGVASAVYVLLYSLARRVSGPSLAAAAAVAVTAMSTGFWIATLRSTPYALAFLCQVISLSLLISDRPVPPTRYALAGAFAGLSMGYHASAMALGVAGVVCALFEPDPGRTRRGTFARITAFGGAMLGVAIASWAVFIAYNGLGTRYFRALDFHSTFLGIEQVPNTSIYTSGSGSAQISSFVASLSGQAGVLVRVAVVVVVLVLARWLWARRPLGSAERRLALATVGNFAGIAGFFLINNTHNGFIFASLTLVPVMIAVAIGRSWIGLAVLVYLAWPSTVDNIEHMMQSQAQAANDPQLAEVRFLEQVMGDRAVLLTPGTPFPEMLYLSHLNLFEVSTGEATHRSNDVPVLHPGEALRARIAWWLGNGRRVIYALGDESTNFTGDLVGAEKERQIFWRNELAARERAPILRQLRAALEASGIEIRETLASPRGNRYAEIGIAERTARTAPPPVAASGHTSRELRSLLVAKAKDGDNPLLPGRIRFLTELEAAIPGDPWLLCDWMALTCEAEGEYDGDRVACRAVRGCDERIGRFIASGEHPHHDGEMGTYLTPAIGRIVHDAAAEALEPILRGGFTVTQVEVRRSTIDLTIRDADHGEYGITLALPDSKRDGLPDGRGRNFLFYLAPAQSGSNPAASRLLLAAAARFDQAIPDAALHGD
jgi:hypothetical protein